MAQTTQLALGTTNATSSNIVIAAGTEAMVGIYTDAAGGLPEVNCTLVLQSPSVAIPVALLNKSNPATLVKGPGTFNVIRPVCLTNIAVFSE